MPPRAARTGDDADRIRAKRGDTLPYRARLDHRQVQGRRDARSGDQCGDRAGRRHDRRSIVMGGLRHRRHSGGRRSRGRRGGDARAAGCRVRAAALPQPRDGAAQRHALRQPVELPRHRHGARLGHPARRLVGHHRRRARQRHGVSNGHGALQLALPVPPDAGRSALSRRSAWSTCRSPPRRSSAPAESTRFVVAARLHLERRSAGRSRRTRHARRRHHRPAHQQRQRHRRAWPTTCG